jgi:polysaccharide deacetylase family protein (PEP-CTERM system associated)
MISAPLNSITVDVEDYFHTEAMGASVPRDLWDGMPTRIENNTQRMFELFASHGVRGTFFFLGWVAERFPGLVREAARLGHELACHSYWHRLIYRLSPAEFREDTRKAKNAVEDAAGMSVVGYRAPSFSLVKGTEWAQEILAELGFLYDSSVCPVNHDLYSNPDAPRVPHRVAAGALLEFPVATVAVGGHNFPVGGGGYLRILPYACTRWGLSRLNQAEGLRAVVYIHPWEIDPEQPRLPASLRSRFRQYTGLGTTAGKLKRMLEDFRFAPIVESFSLELRNTSWTARETGFGERLEAAIS